MHLYIFRVTVVTLMLLIGMGCQTDKSLPKSPNIILILADDLGWADLPAYGNRFNETPNLDRLVEEGMRFTNAMLPVRFAHPPGPVSRQDNTQPG